MTEFGLHCCSAGSLTIAYTLATVGANKLWELMKSEPFVPALGALSGNQAMQMVRAGLKAVYCSGWQVSTLSLVKHMNWSSLHPIDHDEKLLAG